MRGRLITFGVLIAVLALPVSASAAPPIWESSVGAPIAAITNSDDAATTVPMGTFSFPFYGVTHTGAETFGVSSNGVVTFGAGDPSNTPNANDARTGLPRIAALWADLNPATVPPNPDGGTVSMNTFNDDGDAAVDRVVFTWDSVFFGCETAPFNTTCRARAQIQLLETGRIVFGYDGVLTNQARDNYGSSNGTLMPVIAKGGFTAPPGFVPNPTGIDYSAQVPFTGGNLIFEHFTGVPVHFDLDQSNLIFVPVGADAYSVSSPVDIGVTTSASAASASTGDSVTFTSTVTNNGTVPAAGVSLTDKLPDGASGISATTSAGTCAGGATTSCAIGDLAPGASATVTTTATLGQTGTAVNRVDATTTTPGDGQANNSAQSTVAVGGDTLAPQGTLKAPKQTVEDAIAKGVTVNVTCPEACLAEVKLTGKLNAKKATTLGTGVAETPGPGTAKVVVTLTKAAKKALDGAKKAKLKATATITDEAGNATTAKKNVKLK